MTKTITYTDEGCSVSMTQLPGSASDQCGWEVQLHVDGVYDYNDLNLTFKVQGAGEQYSAAKLFRLLANQLESRES